MAAIQSNPHRKVRLAILNVLARVVPSKIARIRANQKTYRALIAMRMKHAIAVVVLLAGFAAPARADYDSALTALILDERIAGVGWISKTLLVEVIDDGSPVDMYIEFICRTLAENKVSEKNGTPITVEVSDWKRPDHLLASTICPGD